MARKVGRIVAPNGSYEKDGQQKTRWLTCGTLLKTDNGLRIKMDAIPVESDGWFSVFTDDDKPQASQDNEPDLPF